MVNKKNTAILRAELAKRRRIVVLSHVNPDGDSIGSSLALYHFLRQEEEREVSVIIPNDLPAFLQWLPGAGEIIVGKHAPVEAARLIAAAEMIFFLDFNDESRLKKLESPVRENRTAFRVLIDHHPSPVIKADLLFSETRVSSTAELLFEVLGALDKSVPDQAVAVNLYAGIMTYTGCFRYNASYPNTWKVVAELMRAGINIDEIYTRIYDNYSEHRMRLMGYALDKKMVILPEKHTGYIWLTRDELDRYGYVTGDTEGFVNLPLSVEGIRFSALFLELGDKIKISFRSKGSFAVNRFSAAYFNGGGHHNAAGGECAMTMTETLKKFESLIGDFADEI